MSSRRRRIEARIRLTRLALGGWAAQALFVATDAGVFDLLDRAGPSSGSDIAAALGTDPDTTVRLLGALVAMGLLERDGVRFANSATTAELLVTGKPETMAGWLSLMQHWTENFASLPRTLQTGERAATPQGASAGEMRSYMLGMHEYAVGPGRELAGHLDLRGRRRLLDVGGGPGTYAILLAEANPELTGTIFDLPDVVAIAAEVIDGHGLSGRLDVRAGDYHSDPLPQGYDVVLISNTLHQEDEAASKRVVEQAFRALEPGGVCVVHAMPLSASEDGPLWPALLNLHLRLVSRGRAYTVDQYREQLVEAGFVEPVHRTMSTSNANSYIVARRP